jgi:hypothetical protein
MDLQGIQHSLPRHNDLLGLLLHRQRPNQGRNLNRAKYLRHLERKIYQKFALGSLNDTQILNQHLIQQETMAKYIDLLGGDVWLTV